MTANNLTNQKVHKCSILHLYDMETELNRDYTFLYRRSNSNTDMADFSNIVLYIRSVSWNVPNRLCRYSSSLWTSVDPPSLLKGDGEGSIKRESFGKCHVCVCVCVGWQSMEIAPQAGESHKAAESDVFRLGNLSSGVWRVKSAKSFFLVRCGGGRRVQRLKLGKLSLHDRLLNYQFLRS
jgi:hypothetical protein